MAGSLTSMFGLEGKVALVTGAGGHLGPAICGGLAAAGAHVCLNGRVAGGLEALAADFNARGLAASVACFDVLDADARKAFFDDAAKRYGRIDILVHNAYAGGTACIEEARGEDFAGAYRIAVEAAAALVQDGLPLLRETARRAGDAAIVTIASMYASVSPDPRIYKGIAGNPPFYGAAKAGLVQLTRYLAVHLAKDCIRANAISPGAMPSRAVQECHPGFLTELESKVPLGRIGTPDDLSGAVVFLASPAARYVTGVNLAVDGGWTVW